MLQLRCPTCRKEFDAAQSEALPFCSQRCRQIDLGRWLSEEQRLPANIHAEDDEEAEPPKGPQAPDD
jgi:hypothetical protein